MIEISEKRREAKLNNNKSNINKTRRGGRGKKKRKQTRIYKTDSRKQRRGIRPPGSVAENGTVSVLRLSLKKTTLTLHLKDSCTAGNDPTLVLVTF